MQGLIWMFDVNILCPVLSSISSISSNNYMQEVRKLACNITAINNLKLAKIAKNSMIKLHHVIKIFIAKPKTMHHKYQKDYFEVCETESIFFLFSICVLFGTQISKKHVYNHSQI